MHIPRVFTDQPLQIESRVRLAGDTAHRLGRVLRLRAGAPLRLFNGDGREYQGRITTSGKHELEVEVLEAGAPEPLARLRLTLILGISRAERMDFALQKAVELGVHRLIPVASERTQGRLSQERQTRRDRHWRQILISACEQCGRCSLPHLDPAGDLDTRLRELPGQELRLLLDPGGSKTLCQLPPPSAGVILLVGPEGGLSGRERKLALAQTFTPVRFGPRILRTETAPLAALAALQTLWGDFCGD